VDEVQIVVLLIGGFVIWDSVKVAEASAGCRHTEGDSACLTGSVCLCFSVVGRVLGNNGPVTTYKKSRVCSEWE